MRRAFIFCWLTWAAATAAGGQQVTVDPQVRTRNTTETKITTVEIAPHFVTTIRVPEPVNSVVVGDPALFQVEPSEHEPQLVFVKALTTEEAESNLLISTATGRQISFMLVSHSKTPAATKVDFLVRYRPAGGFLVEPETIPTALVAQTTAVTKAQPAGVGQAAIPATSAASIVPASFNPTGNSSGPAASPAKAESLDGLLERQKQAPLPVLYGGNIEGEEVKGDRLRTGVSEVIDGGQR